MIRKIAIIAFWIALPLMLFTIMGFVQYKQKGEKLKSIDISIDYSEGNFFVDQDEIKSILYSKGDSLVGTKQFSSSLSTYEKLINQHPSVQKAQVYAAVDGKIFINIRQRNPVLRVMNNFSGGFYIDEEGKYMPLSNKYTARVIIANGYNEILPNDSIVNGFADGSFSITNLPSGKSMLADLYSLAAYINKDTLWNALFDQIYINENSEFELIPKVGLHKILLGDIQNLEQKLQNLKLFYKKGLNRKGWNDYEVINLKYHNQVVCTKKKNETLLNSNL